MNKSVLFLTIFTLLSCQTTDIPRQYGGNLISDDQIQREQDEIKRFYVEYETPDKAKFLVQTSTKIRTIKNVPTMCFLCTTGDKEVIKYYFSVNQSSYLYGFLEAYEYCKIDNPEDYTLCIPSMIGDFNVNSAEFEFLMLAVSDNYFDVTIKNFGFAPRINIYEQTPVSGARNLQIWAPILNPLLCDKRKHAVFDRFNNNKKFEYEHFNWLGCKTSIRPAVELPIENPLREVIY